MPVFTLLSKKSAWNRLYLVVLVGTLLSGPMLLMSLWGDVPPAGRAQQPTPYPYVGEIRGTILLPDGKPDHTEVRLWQVSRGDNDVVVHTNRQGEFVAERLPYGRHWVMAHDQLVANVELTMTKPNSTVRGRLKSSQSPIYPVVSGVVRDKETGRPIAGALVMGALWSRSPFHWKYRSVGTDYEWAHYSVKKLIRMARHDQKPFALTDAQGRYALKLTAGRTSLFAVAPGTEFFPQEWETDLRKNVAHDFTLEKRQRYIVRGRISLPNGEPYANKTAKFIMRRNPTHVYSIHTDADGRYSFLPKWYVTNIQWLDALGWSMVHQHTALTDGPPFPELNWTLKRSQKGTLIAQLFRPDGKTPYPDGHRVHFILENQPSHKMLLDQSGKPRLFYTKRCAHDGAASFSFNIKNGIMRGDFDAGIFRMYTSPATLTRAGTADLDDPSWYGPTAMHSDFGHGARDFFPHRITIQPCQTEVMRIVGPKVSAVTISVQDADDKPAADVRIAALCWNGKSRSYLRTGGATTNRNGQALFDPLPSGEYVFYPVLYNGDKQAVTKRAALTLQPGEHHEVMLTLHEWRAAKPDLNREPAKIQGRVFLPDGKTPASYAAIYLHRTNAKPDVLRSAQRPDSIADKKGRFTLETYRNEKVTLLVQGDDTALTVHPVSVKKEVEVVTVVLERGAIIRGKVLGAKRESDVALSVTVLSAPRNEIATGPPPRSRDWLPSLLFTNVAQPVAPDGTFAIHRVRPGTHYLCLYRNGQLQSDQVTTLVIEKGEREQRVTLKLQPMIDQFQARLRRVDGKPLPKDLYVTLYSDYGRMRCGGLELAGNIVTNKYPLSPGMYHIHVSRRYNVPRIPKMMPTSYVFRNIEIDPTETPQLLELSIPKTGGIKGKLVLADGTTPGRAFSVSVHLPQPKKLHYFETDPVWQLADHPDLPPCHAKTRTAPDGNFVLHGLAPGSYRLSFVAEDRHAPLHVSQSIEVIAGKIMNAGKVVLERCIEK